MLRNMGSRRAGFSSCGAWAQLLRGMWDLSGPGIESMSPALAGGFLSTAPPGKSQSTYLNCTGLCVSTYVYTCDIITLKKWTYLSPSKFAFAPWESLSLSHPCPDPNHSQVIFSQQRCVATCMEYCQPGKLVQALVLMPKTRPLCTGAELNLGDKSLG